MHLTGPDKKRRDSEIFNHSLKSAHGKISNFVNDTHPAFTEFFNKVIMGNGFANHRGISVLEILGFKKLFDFLL